MIGKNIYEIRRRRGLTLTELADRAGIAKSYLSSIERNLNKNPSVNVMEKLALVLGVDLKALLNTEKQFESDNQQLDKEWIQFVTDLKDSGIGKDQLKEYKTLLEFIKWQNEKKMK